MNAKLEAMLEEARRESLTNDILESLAGLSAPDAPMYFGDDNDEVISDVRRYLTESEDLTTEELLDILKENGYDLTMENLEMLKEGLATGEIGLLEDDEIGEYLDILEENGYDPTEENLNALIEGIADGTIAIVDEDNLDYDADVVDNYKSTIAPNGITNDSMFKTDGEPGTDRDPDDANTFINKVIDPDINGRDEEVGEVKVTIEKDPLKEAMDNIMNVFSEMKLSEECCEETGDIDDEVVYGGGLATGDTALVRGVPAGCKKVNPLVNGGVYVPARAKKDVHPRTIKEAVLLTPAYFNENSFEVVTPEKKEERLITQLAIKIAKEKMDPMYQELLKAASEAKRLQDAIVEKYKDDASSKSNQITGKKSNETVYDPEPEEDDE